MAVGWHVVLVEEALIQEGRRATVTRAPTHGRRSSGSERGRAADRECDGHLCRQPVEALDGCCGCTSLLHSRAGGAGDQMMNGTSIHVARLVRQRMTQSSSAQVRVSVFLGIKASEGAREREQES